MVKRTRWEYLKLEEYWLNPKGVTGFQGQAAQDSACTMVDTQYLWMASH